MFEEYVGSEALVSVADLRLRALALAVGANRCEIRVGWQETAARHQAAAAGDAGRQMRVLEQVDAARPVTLAPAKLDSVDATRGDVEPTRVHRNGSPVWEDLDVDQRPDIPT